MKSNRDFLDGVYSKAEEIRLNNNIKTMINKKYIRYSSAAALIILIPMLFFANSRLGYREIPQISMVRTLSNPSSYFNEADLIVIGEIREIGKSTYVEEENYIYTDITISLDEVLLGEFKAKEIILRVNGGKDKKAKVYSPMEGEFNEGERSLFFLIKSDEKLYQLIHGKDSQFIEIENNVFVDKLGNKYSLEEIKNTIMMGEN